MIEWIPIKEFLETGEDEDEEFLFYNKISTRVVTTSIDILRRKDLIKSFTHAAYINFPVEKTLEEKFEDWAKENKVLSSHAYFPILAQIAKEHYEGGGRNERI